MATLHQVIRYKLIKLGLLILISQIIMSISKNWRVSPFAPIKWGKKVQNKEGVKVIG